MLKWRVFVGKTGPFPFGQVIHVVGTVAMVQFWVESEPEPTREFAPFANTSLGTMFVTLENSITTTLRTLWNCKAMPYFRETLISFF
jgi:hypothetical protein